MPESTELFELHKAHDEGQAKHTYFLLAGAASGIGFAVTRTDGLTLSWWLLPVGLSAVSWGLSFFAGCRAVQWTQACTYANSNLLSLQKGLHPEQPEHPQAAAAAMRGVQKALSSNMAKLEFWSKLQFRLLITGGVLFVAWRLLEMIRLGRNAV